VLALALVVASCDGEGMTLEVGAPVDAPLRPDAELAFWDGREAIKIARVDGREANRLLPLELKTVERWFLDRVSWSPDGRRLAFTGVPGGYTTSRDIWTIDADGGRARRLTRTEDALWPVWAPDGRSIVYARLENRRRNPFESADYTSSLWAIDPDGTDRRRVTDPERGVTERPWSFAPDGSQLAITRARVPALERRAAKTRVVLVELDGSGERELTGSGTDPSFSPDGSRIAYASPRDRNGTLSYGDILSVANELYVMNADGSKRRRLTRTRNVNELGPSWSPNGARIAYHRGRQYQNAEIYSIWQINADGSCPEALFAGRPRGDWYASPVWRPAPSREPLEGLRC
jgi:Tol biopolymer transport system component